MSGTKWWAASLLVILAGCPGTGATVAPSLKSARLMRIEAPPPDVSVGSVLNLPDLSGTVSFEAELDVEQELLCVGAPRGTLSFLSVEGGSGTPITGLRCDATPTTRRLRAPVV